MASLKAEYVKHMDVSGCCGIKTGYCTLPNGVGFVATTVTAPGIRAEVMAHYIEHFNPPEAEPVYMAELCYYRQMENCYESRVNFWIGMHYKDGASQIHLPDGQPVSELFSSALARHSVWETTTFMRNVLEFWKDCQ